MLQLQERQQSVVLVQQLLLKLELRSSVQRLQHLPFEFFHRYRCP
jgi:hypothetical protein